MKIVEDAIDRGYLLKQIHMMLAQKRALLSTSVGANNALGTAFDAGYMACLTELEAILIWPDMDADTKYATTRIETEVEDDDAD